jgi:hypothetical protein
MNKKEKVVIIPPTKREKVNLVKTSYHYYRNWIKSILSEGSVKDFKFLKDKTGWNGAIIISKEEAEKARFVLKDYKLMNPEIVDLWW